jgi:hypothetical protein
MSVRRHLSYANVVATMALVFAMGGTAVAAKHYLISSTSQISPQVLKALELKIASRVKPGSPGAEGAQGKEGPAGREGKEGAAGKEGSPGKEGLTGNEGKEGKAVDVDTSLLSEAEQNELKSILYRVSYLSSGVDGKPTIQFSGVNLQIVSGAGTEQAPVNGVGNLVVGYDESPSEQTGSNNIVIGSSKQAYTSFGAILGGEHNLVEGPFSDAFGSHNDAVGDDASVSGGYENTSEEDASSISGGAYNQADGEWSSVSGGYENTTKDDASSISGGDGNEAVATQASVDGGYHNKAEGEYSSVAGGKDNTATALYEPLP